MFSIIFDMLNKFVNTPVNDSNWKAKGTIFAAYGEERDREAKFKKYGYQSYDYYDLYSVLEVGLINPFVAYEISVDIHSNSSTTDCFKVLFALDDTYKTVQLIHINRSYMPGSLEDAQKYVDMVRTYLADCNNIQECKAKIMKLERNLRLRSLRSSCYRF